MLASKQSRTLRKKGKTTESVNLSLANHMKLAYNRRDQEYNNSTA